MDEANKVKYQQKNSGSELKSVEDVNTAYYSSENNHNVSHEDPLLLLLFEIS